MLTTLVAVLCHALSGVPAPVCLEEIVTTSDYPTLAGKADAPITVPGLTFQACQINGQAAIAEWMSEHPLYHSGWWLERWKCVPGHYEIGKRA